MPKYRSNPPVLSDRVFLTDGGIETTLIFHEGLDLPYFAAFHLLKDGAGRAFRPERAGDDVPAAGSRGRVTFGPGRRPRCAAASSVRARPRLAPGRWPP